MREQSKEAARSWCSIGSLGSLPPLDRPQHVRRTGGGGLVGTAQSRPPSPCQKPHWSFRIAAVRAFCCNFITAMTGSRKKSTFAVPVIILLQLNRPSTRMWEGQNSLRARRISPTTLNRTFAIRDRWLKSPRNSARLERLWLLKSTKNNFPRF